MTHLLAVLGFSPRIADTGDGTLLRRAFRLRSAAILDDSSCWTFFVLFDALD